MHQETKFRSLVKTVSWRVIATLVTLSAAYVFTGKIFESLAITLAAAALNMVAYYLHERAWNKVDWGKD